MRTSFTLAAAAILGALVATGNAQSAPPADQEPAKQRAAAALKPGDVLGTDNWELAKDLLPPEILRHYKDGEYANKIVEWPAGIYKWDPQFKAATEANAGQLTVSPQGTIVYKGTGQQPPLIYGLPFPIIDPSDPYAG